MEFYLVLPFRIRVNLGDDQRCDHSGSEWTWVTTKGVIIPDQSEPGWRQRCDHSGSEWTWVTTKGVIIPDQSEPGWRPKVRSIWIRVKLGDDKGVIILDQSETGWRQRCYHSGRRMCVSILHWTQGLEFHQWMLSNIIPETTYSKNFSMLFGDKKYPCRLDYIW